MLSVLSKIWLNAANRGLTKHEKTAPLLKHLGKHGIPSGTQDRSAGPSLESSLEGMAWDLGLEGCVEFSELDLEEGRCRERRPQERTQPVP